MKVCAGKTPATCFPTWIPLLFLLACGSVKSVESQILTAAISIDASGEVENVAVESAVNADSKHDGNKNDGEQKTPLDFANDQVDWLLSKGGTFARESIAIKSFTWEGVTDLGVFATENIKEKSILMKIPTSVMILPGM